jgi:hypothetical protein
MRWQTLQLLRHGHLLGVLVFSLSLGACSGDSWKEEALQPDGSTIIVTRTVERGGRHEIGQPGSYVHQTLSFKMPASGQAVEWVDALSPDLGNSSFLPKLLGVSKGVAYLLASPMGCLSYNKWGRPNPPYVIFKYINKQWDRVELKELPLEFRTPNLVPSNPDVEARKTGESPVSAKTIAIMVSEYQQPERKSILREKINYDPECISMSSNGKGRWRATAWFETKPDIESCRSACLNDGYDEKHCPCNSIFQRK